jgi:putative flippase GtrA
MEQKNTKYYSYISEYYAANPTKFEKRKNNVWKQILFFCSAFGVAYTAQFLFLILLVEGLDVNEYLAQFLGLFIYGAANFIANKKITFQ